MTGEIQGCVELGNADFTTNEDTLFYVLDKVKLSHVSPLLLMLWTCLFPAEVHVHCILQFVPHVLCVMLPKSKRYQDILIGYARACKFYGYAWAHARIMPSTMCILLLVLCQSRPLDNYVSEGPCVDSPTSVSQRHVSDCMVFENPLRSDESIKPDAGPSRLPYRARLSAPAMVGVNFHPENGHGFSKRSSTPEIAMFLNEAFSWDQEGLDSDDERKTSEQKRRSRVDVPRRSNRESFVANIPTGGTKSSEHQLKPPEIALSSGTSTTSSVKRAQSFNSKRIPAPPKPARSPMRSYSLRTTGSLPQIATHKARTPTGPSQSLSLVPLQRERHSEKGKAATPEAVECAQAYTSTPVILTPLSARSKPQPPPVVVRRRELPRPPSSGRSTPNSKRSSRVRSLQAQEGDVLGSKQRGSSSTTDAVARHRASSSQRSSPRPPRRRRPSRRPRSNSLGTLTALYTNPKKNRYENWPPSEANGCENCRVDLRKARSCHLSADSYDGGWEDSEDDIPDVPDRTLASYQLYSTVAGVSKDHTQKRNSLSRMDPTSPYDRVLPINSYDTIKSIELPDKKPTRTPPPPPKRSSRSIKPPEHPYETLKLQKQPPYASLVGQSQERPKAGDGTAC